MSKINMSQEELSKIEKMERKTKKKTIGLNAENFDISSTEEKQNIAVSFIDLDTEKQNLILGYFLNHKTTKQIIQGIDKEVPEIHKAVVDNLQNYIVRSKTDSKEKTLRDLRIKTIKNDMEICIQYAYDSTPICPKNFKNELPNLVDDLKKGILQNILKNKSFCKNTIKHGVENLQQNEMELKIFPVFKQKLRFALIMRISDNYCSHLKENDFTLLNVGLKYKISKKGWDDLLSFLKYDGIVTNPIIWWEWDKSEEN